ncbi:MAG: DUF7619 domain-containing protein, partial [Bacteroidota bacterium]
LSATQSSGTPGPFDFSWTNNQTLLTYPGNNISVPLGAYSVIITDQTTGCTMQIADTAVNIQQLSNVNATINTTTANCTNGTATAAAFGGVAPYTYLWANGSTSSSITGISQGYYSLTVTDAQGCESNNLGAYVQQSLQISVNTTITNATCTQNDGGAIAFGSGGVNPYTYAWSNGQTGNTANSLSGPNSYTVIATDANGCTGLGYAYVNVNTPINVTYTSTPSQCTSPTGTATLSISGGTAPYTVNWNTIPAVSGTVLSNFVPGNYQFEVTDAVGCVRTGSVTINSASTLYVNAAASTVVCPNTTGTITANASGSNPPFTYLWSNGSTSNQITGVSGGHSVVVTDALGCSRTVSAGINIATPVYVSVLTTPVSCIYSTDGAASSTVIGGLAPYNYSYTSGANTPNTNGLGVGNYYLNVTDANGCSASKHFVIGNSNTSTNCFSTISGNVYVDANSNCVYDFGEIGVENIMIHCSGFGYTFTDANGYYSFQVPTGTYTISEQVNAYYPLASCQSNSNSVSVVSATGLNATVDFTNSMNIIHDLHVVTVSSYLPPIPGNIYHQKVIVKNEGTVTESGIQMGYKHDSQIPFVSSSLSSFVQLNSTGAPYSYSVQSGFPALSPNGTSVIQLNYNTPTNIPLGTTLNYYDTVADAAPIDVNWLLDYTPWNNVNTYQTSVIGSYDPNYKEVSPKGLGAQGYINSTVNEFDYTIHFQNEGTYFAQNIVITDQLDPDLDWLTFKPGYSDYSYSATVSETGLVTFKFDNINLPWKGLYGDALSSGLVNYSIQRKSTNPQGTVFTNKANIYFDYNAPIETNTTINTLDDALAGVEQIAEKVGESITIELYPVPAKDFFTIRINN